MTKSFLIKHEKLLKEENEIKEKLQNEVTKVKEKLEYFWSKSNNEIKKNEKINQGIKKIKNEEKNINKILSYVSNINKNQKELNKLIKEPMKSLKFNYIEEKSIINYEEFFFYGISIPQNIEFKYISDHNLNIFWKVDNYNINNIDKNKIKFKVEMRKNKEKFNQVYEGNNLNCIIKELEEDTEYEFRICSFYDNKTGLWSDIQKVKTLDKTNSIILKDQKKKNEFLKKMLEWSGYEKMELIYRGSRDGMTSKNFHDKCDNKGPTITLYQNEKCIFGGYHSGSWLSNNQWYSSSDCFIFTLVNIYNIEPTKFTPKNNNYAVYNGSSYGPCFGNGFDIGNDNSDFLNNDSYANFPYSYQDVLGKGKSIFTGDLNNDKIYFKLKELEVFILSK